MRISSRMRVNIWENTLRRTGVLRTPPAAPPWPHCWGGIWAPLHSHHIPLQFLGYRYCHLFTHVFTTLLLRFYKIMMKSKTAVVLSLKRGHSIFKWFKWLPHYDLFQRHFGKLHYLWSHNGFYLNKLNLDVIPTQYHSLWLLHDTPYRLYNPVNIRHHSQLSDTWEEISLLTALNCPCLTDFSDPAIFFAQDRAWSSDRTLSFLWEGYLQTLLAQWLQ